MPERTCVVCRRKEDKSKLLRFVLGDGGEVREVVPDAWNDKPGRGAYCHLEGACIFGDGLDELLLASLERQELKRLGKRRWRESVKNRIRLDLAAALGEELRRRGSGRLVGIAARLKEVIARLRPGSEALSGKCAKRVRL